MPKGAKKTKNPKDPKTNKSKRRGEDGVDPYKSAEFEEYGLFMALTRKDRKEVFGFETDKDFAKEHGLDPTTLTRWKYEERLWTVRDKYLLNFKKHTADVIGRLAERAAKSGDAFHALTFMKLVEGYSEKSGVDITTKGKKISGFKVIVHHATPQPPNNGAGK